MLWFLCEEPEAYSQAWYTENNTATSPDHIFISFWQFSDLVNVPNHWFISMLPFILVTILWKKNDTLTLTNGNILSDWIVNLFISSLYLLMVANMAQENGGIVVYYAVVKPCEVHYGSRCWGEASPGKRGCYITHSTHSANKQVVKLMSKTVTKCFCDNEWQQWIVKPWLTQQRSVGEWALMTKTFPTCIIDTSLSTQHTQQQQEWYKDLLEVPLQF